ncbi:hypothetical protein ACLB2K_063129 [Fragaria x ananassa]
MAVRSNGGVPCLALATEVGAGQAHTRLTLVGATLVLLGISMVNLDDGDAGLVAIGFGCGWKQRPPDILGWENGAEVNDERGLAAENPKILGWTDGGLGRVFAGPTTWWLAGLEEDPGDEGVVGALWSTMGCWTRFGGPPPIRLSVGLQWE